MSISNISSIKLPNGAHLQLIDWREGDCTFVPRDGAPLKFMLDQCGILPSTVSMADLLADTLHLGSHEEWLIHGLTVTQESDVLQPPCGLALYVSRRCQWSRDIAALFLATDKPAVRVPLANPVHIGSAERFELRQTGDESNRLTVTLHLYYKLPVA